ncbi:hypothetical protein NL676_017364 [Syzygium grande]|nr:hypothetical protein NL676_017364 [Syzygium grande]
MSGPTCDPSGATIKANGYCRGDCKECLYLYNMKHVDAVLLLLEQIDDHGYLRRVEKCKDLSLLQTWEGSPQYGFR